MNTFFWGDSEKGLHMTLTTLGANFSKSNNVGRHYCPYFQVVCLDFQVLCEQFHVFCPDVQGFCPDFQQIETFGGALAPPPPTSLIDSIL